VRWQGGATTVRPTSAKASTDAALAGANQVTHYLHDGHLRSLKKILGGMSAAIGNIAAA
jgi:hypothetical protein